MTRCCLSLPSEKPMFSGAIDKQHQTFKRNSLLVSMSKDGRKLYIWPKKGTPLLKKLFLTICQISQIFVTSLLLLDIINEWPQFICLCKKVNNCVHWKQINFNTFHLVCINILLLTINKTFFWREKKCV